MCAEQRPADPVYLSRHDVRALAHYAFYIPINRGFHRDHVNRHYPGWTWEQLYPVLRDKARLRRSPGAFSAAHLPEPYVGVFVYRDGSVVLDDGSIEHPAKTMAEAGRTGLRLAEQVRSTDMWVSSPVIVHAPHTSRHIPSAVRRDIIVSDTELTRELDAVTDAGVAQLVNRVRARNYRPLYVEAAFSRLVFDPERFVENEPMGAVGLGVVYTMRSDGTPLRRALDDDRRGWYRAQYDAYTASIERIVEHTIADRGQAVIVDLHSYPAGPLPYEDQTAARPEVCIGTDSFHTPAALESAALAAFSEFDVALNTPFSGSYVPGRLYRTERRVSSIMVEIRRDVLADEAGAVRIERCVTELVRRVEEAATPSTP
jgi:N-formylglutamate deformylase